MEKPENISWYEHEYAMAREERHTNRWRIFAIVLFAAFVLSNACWLLYESQFEDTVTVSQEVDTEDAPAYVNGTGSMTVNGTDKADSN